ncbi:MAG: Ig-like domain-containing protein, partial [Chloroflexi bacterium]|nr:Ig-like domain-containing protein [Chloroflexota bacterium]
MKKRIVFSALFLLLTSSLLLLLSSCNQEQPVTPTPEVSPTSIPATVMPSAPTVSPAMAVATVPPLAPKVVSMIPARGEELAPDQPLEIRFDQEIDSADLAFDPPLPGRMEVKGKVVQYVPAVYERGKRYVLQLTARAHNLQTGPLRFHIQTQGYLQVTATTPTDGAVDVSIDSSITVAFNRPVTPLGIAGDDPDLPQPLVFEPTVVGKGVWLNPSIYIFYPDEPLAGGVSYAVTVADLRDISGSTLEAPYTFHFTTAPPSVINVQPSGDLVPPTTTITVTFSQPMDASATAAAFKVTAEKTLVAGEIGWAEKGRQLIFVPAKALPMGAEVQVSVSKQAKSVSGTPIRSPRSWKFSVAPYPAVRFTIPRDGADYVALDEAVSIHFTAPVLEETLHLEISPPISATQVYSWYST